MTVKIATAVTVMTVGFMTALKIMTVGLTRAGLARKADKNIVHSKNFSPKSS
jgi:hypothetical protein